MAENIRKRRSKWDLKSKSDINAKIEDQNAQPGYAVNVQHGEPYADRGSSKHHISSLDHSSAAPQASNLLKSERDPSPASKWSLTEAINRGRSSDGFYENRNEKADTTDWGTGLDESHSANTFTHQDERQLLSDNGSPKAERRRLYRNQSRSRSRSRSWSRSRSRSPRSFLDSRRETERRNDRSRSEIERSELLCRDFVAGRCRKGGQCKFLHKDGGRSPRLTERNYHDAAIENIRENRYERGKSTGYDNCKHFSGSMEQWHYSREKLPYRQGSLSDREKHDFKRSEKSTEQCMNFMRGRCQKGSDCRYVHHDPSRDGGTNGDNRARERIFERELDVSSKHDHRQDYRRTYDNPCKFFAEGRCRNGEKCRFSHQAVLHNHHELKHQNDKWDRNWGDEKSLSHDGKISGHGVHVDQHKRSCWEDNNRNGKGGSSYTMERQEHASDRQYHQPQNLKHVKYEALSKEVPEVILPVQEQIIVRETLNQLNECDSNHSLQSVDENVHIEKYPGFEGERATCAGRIDTSQSQDNMNSNVANQHILGSVPGPSFKEYDQRQDASHVSSGQSLDPSVLNQHGVFPAIVTDNSQQQLVYSSTPNLQSRSVIPLDTAMQSSDSIGQIKLAPPPSQHHMENKETSHSLSLNEESQISSFSSVPTLQNFNATVQGHNFHFPSPRPTAMHAYSRESTKADAVETKVSDVNPALPIDNKTVTSEQFAQITNISASLAQLFGNGQKLPQLYAALNLPSSTGSLPTCVYSQHNSVIPPVAAPAPFAQPFQQQFANPSTAGPPFQSNSRMWSEHLPQATEASLIDPKNLPQDTSTLAPTGDPMYDGDANRITDIDEKLETARHEEVKQVRMGNDNELKDANGVSEDKIKKKKETEQVEEDERDSHADGQNKKSKDGKGIRMFKYALVELVKDILKPTWKEGTISKEAHKTVVKKVVEKVTGTLQSNIPQSQEKIDHYLTYSKPKLGKLVQAYLDKYSKV